MSHPLAAGPDVDLAALAGQPFVDTASAPGHCAAAALDACRAAGSTPAYAVTADEHPTTQGLVAAGLGVALVPALAALLDAAGQLDDGQTAAGPLGGR